MAHRKLTIFGVVLALSLAGITYAVVTFTEQDLYSSEGGLVESIDLSSDNGVVRVLETAEHADIIMPTKSSRPGCEDDDLCYIPSTVTVSVGDSVTWKNEDSAFHSVTSGVYGSPDGLFDSGHIDPDDTFTLVFEKQGTYNFFCTLHPWMEGNVQVIEQ